MPAENKVGTQLLVSEHVRARAQALALVRKESVAEIWRSAVEGFGLPGMERKHRVELEKLDAVLAGLGDNRAELLNKITQMRIGYGDLFTKTGEPVRRLPVPAGWRGTGARTRTRAEQ